MRRHIVVLLLVGLVAGSMAPAAEAKKKPKKPAAPVPVDVIHHIVWNGEGCALSVTTTLASEEDACADPLAGALGEQFGSGPWLMPTLDGVPLTLDATKPIKGKISTESYYLTGDLPVNDIMGVGQAQLEVKLTGVSDGSEIVIGELVSDPYLVTPDKAEYVVEFEIQPAAELQGKVFQLLTLSLELTGEQMFHGVLPADGTSTLTIGALS